MIDFAMNTLQQKKKEFVQSLRQEKLKKEFAEFRKKSITPKEGQKVTLTEIYDLLEEQGYLLIPFSLFDYQFLLDLQEERKFLAKKTRESVDDDVLSLTS